MPENLLTSYTFAQKFLSVVILAMLLGWIIDRAILSQKLDERITRGMLNNRTKNSSYSVDNFLACKDSALLQQKSEFHTVYKILKSWRLWSDGKNKWCVGFASTALGMLDCRTLIDFRERHLVISKHAKLKFTDSELASLELFVEAALEHER